MKIGADYYFYHNDHIGTPQKITSVSGAVVWSARYSSFGEASIEVGTVTNNLRFPGQFYDAETGLHYNYHRYYDPKTGRYLSADPIGLIGGINLFAYVQDNPLKFADPKGLDSEGDVDWSDLYKLVKDVKKAAERALKGECDPCRQAFSTSRYTCDCVFENKGNPDGMAQCFCWNSPDPVKCEKKAKELMTDVF
jgi:RHS repeat-associated protein